MVLAYASHSQVFFPTPGSTFSTPRQLKSDKSCYKDPVKRDDTLTSEVISGGSVDEDPLRY